MLPYDDYDSVDALVSRVAIAVLVVAVPAWTVASLTLILGRMVHDRRRAARARMEPRAREVTRLIRRAGGRPRTELGKRRRITAVARLAKAGHPATPRLVRPLVEDPDPALSSAAIRVLGDLGDEWAVDRLIGALKSGHGPRSRVATEIERLAPAPGPKLVPLLRSRNPVVRFWAATLLRPYPELAGDQLVALTWDADANVRAAAAETLATRTGPGGRHRPARLPRGFRVVRPRARRTCDRRGSRGRGRSDDRPPPRRRGLVGADGGAGRTSGPRARCRAVGTLRPHSH